MLSDVRMGVQRPRVALVPPSVSSDADLAIELASRYGLVPFEWQEYVLAGWLGRTADGLWAAPRCGLAVPRQNGKNALLEMRELYGMVLLGETFLHTAHEVKTARKAFMRLRSFFENTRRHPELAALVKDIRQANGQEAIYLTNGGSVEFVARSKGSGRGYTVDVLVCDEAQQYSDEKQAALLPTISASPSGNPQYIQTGTPPWGSMEGDVWRRTRSEGMAGASRLCWHDWGCELGADLDSSENIAAANPSLGGLLSWPTVWDERGATNDETFSHERLGTWPDDGSSSLIDAAEWVRLEAEPSTPAVFAVDGSLDGVVAVAGCGAGPTVQVVEHKDGTEWVVDRCRELDREFQASVWVVDEASPVAWIARELDAAGLVVHRMKAAEVAAAAAQLVAAVPSAGFGHVRSVALDAAVAGCKERPFRDGGFFLGRRASEVDISPLTSVSAALWAWSVYGEGLTPGDITVI